MSPDDQSTTIATPAVSVVICVRNGAHDLSQLFTALRRQTLHRACFEVIVVDDASTDGTAAVVENEGWVRLLQAQHHVGLPRARNLGMAAARAPVIALTDADTIPDDAWLELGVRRMSAPELDMLAGGIVVPLGDRPSMAALLDASAHFNQEAYVARGYGAGANLWLRRDLVERTGGFNERLAAYGGDDNEFGQRATGSGATLIYAPDVNLTHPPRSSLRSLIRKRYMLGYGLAAHRRYNTGPLGQKSRLFLKRRGYALRFDQLNTGRLQGAGYDPTRTELLKLHVGLWLFMQLPRQYGDLRGELSFMTARDCCRYIYRRGRAATRSLRDRTGNRHGRRSTRS